MNSSMAFFGSAAVGAGSGGGEMAGFLPAKVKRKDLEGVYDDFSEFSLSSPARKMRRLDLELTPIMEEEELAAALPPVFGGQPIPREQVTSSSARPLTAVAAGAGPAALSTNEERSLVLYKPVNKRAPESPSSSKVVFTVDADLIARLKNQAFWSGQQSQAKKPGEEKEEEASSMDANQAAADECLAVVPWLPSQFGGVGDGMRVVSGSMDEPMESEEVEGSSSMDVEEEEEGGGQARGTAFNGMGASEGLQQWQQHCMTPQPPQNTSTPIMWSWG